MKKILYGATAVALVVTLSIGIGCKKDNPVNCTDKASKMSAAAVAFQADDSKANCEAYKAALQDLVNSCGGTMSASEKETYQAMIDDMTCP